MASQAEKNTSPALPHPETSAAVNRRTQIVGWFLLFLVFILIPGIIFDRVVSDIANQYEEDLRQTHAQKASELYSAVENEFNV
ncbi:MAG TPA: hypothetical protein PKO06_25005, partial [Candidatus Ozemobacteraceae bacterium]|nr:hypothetical protein [Candidatus Ozemobacteraceae bacterium]